MEMNQRLWNRWRTMWHRVVTAVHSSGHGLTDTQLEAILGRLDLIMIETRRQNFLTQLTLLSDSVMRFNYRGKEFRFYVPDAVVDSIQYLIVHSATFYEVEILETVHKLVDLRGACMIDAGANIGNHSVFFTKICGAEKCIAFEANPYTATVLKKNAQLNGADEIEVRSEALSDGSGDLEIDRSLSQNLGATSFIDREGGPIRSITIDSLDLSRLDFLKIDVEGMAARVLQGARRTIEKYRPAIFVELFPEEYAAGEHVLSDLGYRQMHSLGDANYIFRFR
jgi:FkbM family methyltransferase